MAIVLHLISIVQESQNEDWAQIHAMSITCRGFDEEKLRQWYRLEYWCEIRSFTLRISGVIVMCIILSQFFQKIY